MSNQDFHAPAGGQSTSSGLTRTGRALLAGVLGGLTLGALYGVAVAFLSGYGSWTDRAAEAVGFVPLGGTYGTIAGVLAGAAIAVALPLLRRARLAAVRLAFGVVAAPAPVLAMALIGALSGAGFLERAILSLTLPAGIVAGIAAAAAAPWIVTGHLRSRPNNFG